MCKLCEFAKANEAFRSDTAKATVEDINTLFRTRKMAPESASLFANFPGWIKLKFDFARFEPLAAFPNPQTYYQPLYVDGEKLRNDWQSGWTRSIGFLPDGNLLLHTKAVERGRFEPGADTFQHLYAVVFKPEELQIDYSPPKFTIRADEVKKEGVSLIGNTAASHTFSFAFSHLAIEKSAMRADAIRQSAFLRQVLRRGKTEDEAAKDKGITQAPKSDFEKFSITTLHYAPHPLLMRGFREMGYENRFALQMDVPKFLDEHFSRLMAKA